MENDPYLSVIIPAYTEGELLGRTLLEIEHHLGLKDFRYEILVIVDGSPNNTGELAKNYMNRVKNLRVIENDVNRGKGYAVRKGIEQTSSEYVMFADSGLCVPYADTLLGLDLIKYQACDIAHGSRKMKECNIEKDQSFYRHLCSKMFHWFVIHDMKIPAEFTDTQCGFKIYKGDVARHLYSECITDGFTFDIEIIMRAQKEGYTIKEFPIDWTCDRDSRLSPTRSSWSVLSELLTIRRVMAKE